MGLGQWNGKRHLPISSWEGSWAQKMATQQGRSAAHRGIPYTSNPHPEGSLSRLAWSQGHNGARAGKLQRQHDGQA